MLLSVGPYAWATVICQSHFVLVDFLHLLFCFYEQKYLSYPSSKKEYLVSALSRKLSIYQHGKQDISLLGSQESLPTCFHLPCNMTYVASTIVIVSSAWHLSISITKMLRAIILARTSLKDPSLMLTHLELISSLSSLC